MADELQPSDPIVTAKNGAIAVSALIVGALTVSLVGKDRDDVKDVPVTLETIPSGIVRVVVDAGPEPEVQGPLMTDVLTELVPPGKRVVATVNLPDGWAPIGEITLTGEAVDHFKVIASQLVGTEEKIMAENVGDTPVRFSAVFSYDKAK